MGNWYEERLYPQQPFRENITKAVSIHSLSPEAAIRPSLVSTVRDSRGLFPDSKEEPSGKLSIESFLMMALYFCFKKETRRDSAEGLIS